MVRGSKQQEGENGKREQMARGSRWREGEDGKREQMVRGSRWREGANGERERMQVLGDGVLTSSLAAPPPVPVGQMWRGRGGRGTAGIGVGAAGAAGRVLTQSAIRSPPRG